MRIIASPTITPKACRGLKKGILDHICEPKLNTSAMPEKTATTYPVATKHEQISAAANEPVYFSGCFQRSTLFKSHHRGVLSTGIS
jgi:hypothetical protein